MVVFGGLAVVGDQQTRSDVLFYDSTCVWCCAAARLIASAHRGDPSVCLAPIGSDAFLALLSDNERRNAPDSLLVKTHDRRLLARSDAVLHELAQLGVIGSFAAALARLVPRRVRDYVYDAIARTRPRRITHGGPHA